MTRRDIEKRLEQIERAVTPPPPQHGGVVLVPPRISSDDLAATCAALPPADYGRAWLIAPATCAPDDWTRLVHQQAIEQHGGETYCLRCEELIPANQPCTFCQAERNDA